MSFLSNAQASPASQKQGAKSGAGISALLKSAGSSFGFSTGQDYRLAGPSEERCSYYTLENLDHFETGNCAEAHEEKLSARQWLQATPDRSLSKKTARK
jgi:hypothetical protein